MKKSQAIGRTIACVIAGVLVIAGVFFLVKAHRIRQEFYRQAQTRPLDLTVDLSRPNDYSAPFKQTWDTCHAQAINLHVPALAETHASPSDLLASLEFNWQITDSDGGIVENNDLSGQPLWYNRPYGDTIPLAYFRPFDLGDYTFSCTVVTGAPALAGLEQRLICQYQPSGVQMLPAFLGNVIGIAALVIAGIILFVVKSSDNNEVLIV